MLRRQIVSFLLMILVLSSFFLVQQEKRINLSSQECTPRAVRNNFEAAVQVINPGLPVVSVSQAEEKFLEKA